MKKCKQRRAERTRRRRARRQEKRHAKGTMTMAEKKMVTVEQIRRHMEKKEYAGVINSFADMLAQGNPPEECFGDVARAYFELGDYTRAASWVTNALAKDAANVEVRILLARICQREKRSDDALKLCENILRVHGDILSDEQRKEISRLAGLDARLAPEKTRTEYPYLAALMGLAAAPVQEFTAAQPARAAVDAEKQAEMILAQAIRPVEKVEALNAFAGAAYVADDYAGAKVLLSAALRLDPGCDMTLKNAALLLHDMGDADKALQMAAKMRQTDFLLLRALKA